ncbi:flagellar biosynthetic protein FliR [Herbinix hemicellulosilytica]|uniref:Flagellar biosynthetic protein FliR n=1 Tax=Herbinix hemicellulosilytica TaxID=1564487 RepID=A0A0H5SW52_HERHM|nr:flagellar biosynthetic protein FliR [Herbinix hemicellulosilytica]RBP60853.1 flagellar biosynthetic protein FliR [Herbinix hemicellulosilytica]CRZ34548.1 putative membrane protein [Herbinix hemicellulosilytica]
MTFTIDNFEIFFLILVRMSGFVYTAPILSLKNIPVRVKAGLSIFLAVILFYTAPASNLDYSGVIGYSILVVKEAIAGTLMGLFSNIAYHILSFAGQMIDMEIGFSMINQLNPILGGGSSITANLYGYSILLIMLITNLHHYFIRAVADSFQVIGLGQAVFPPNMYRLMLQFLVDYFVIAMRIVLPMFAAILIVNTVLGILTKAAPQMNMFVVGIQLKALVGLLVLYLIVGLIPSVADFIYNKMIEMLKAVIEMMK